MSSVTMPRMSKARQPASQAIPRGPAPSPDPASHSVLRVAPSETTTTSVSTVLPSDRWAARTRPDRVALEAGDHDAAAQVHPVLAVQLRGDRADHPAERTHQGRVGALGDGDREVTRRGRRTRSPSR